jgi:lysozyme
MEISSNGIAFIEKEEGKRNDVYHDSRGFLTVGVGHLVLLHDDLHFGDVISDEQVDTFLKADLAVTQNAINQNVLAPLTQNQFDALCSLVFNIGLRNFFNSTIEKDLNHHNYKGAADAFLLWKRAGSNPNELLARRERERALFLSSN